MFLLIMYKCSLALSKTQNLIYKLRRKWLTPILVGIFVPILCRGFWIKCLCISFDISETHQKSNEKFYFYFQKKNVSYLQTFLVKLGPSTRLVFLFVFMRHLTPVREVNRLAREERLDGLDCVDCNPCFEIR